MARHLAWTLVLLCACGDGDPPTTNPPPSERGDPTPSGAPMAAPVEITVGPAGGELASDDGVVRLVIPPGALASPTTVSIQRIENRAFGGIGTGYRFSPADQQFMTPIDVVLSYSDDELEGMFVEAVGVAVQDADGHWHDKRTVKRDATARTLTVTSRSFAVHPDGERHAGKPQATPPASDWARYFAFRLVPVSATVRVDQTLPLQLQFCRRSNPTVGWPIEDAYELVDCRADAPLAGVTPGDWRVEGPRGTVTPDPENPSRATYRAPSRTTDQIYCRRRGEWHACVLLDVTVRIADGGTHRETISTGIKIDCPLLKGTPQAGGTCTPPGWSGSIDLEMTHTESYMDMGDSWIEIETDDSRILETWTLGQSRTEVLNGVVADVIDVNWTVIYRTDQESTFRYTDGCIGIETVRTVASGSATRPSRLKVFHVGTGFMLGVLEMPNRVEFERNITTIDCDGPVESTDTWIVDELFNLLGNVPSLVFLQPRPEDPNLFTGDAVIVHEERNGGRTVDDARARWSIRRMP